MGLQSLSYKYKDGDVAVFWSLIHLDVGPPEPMVNAMAGLKLVTDSGKKLADDKAIRSLWGY